MSRNRGHWSQEFGAIMRNKKVLIPVIAVCLIPLLYSFMFIWAFWDPYGKVDHLPVAVVNLDQGAELDGKTLKIGEDFSENLKKTSSFEWHFVTLKDAENGLKHNEYYMAIEIPEDFSKKATEVFNDKPEPATFRYRSNESSNFLAAQIGKSAMERIKNELSTQITKTYTETLFTSVTKLSDGLGQAADGAQKLADGSKSVESGAQQVDDGLTQLGNGTQPLLTGVNQLSGGASRLNDGIGKLSKGAIQLQDGLTQLKTGHDQLALGATAAADGAGKLSAGLTSSVTGMEQLKTGSAGVSAGLEQIAAAYPELAKDPNFAKLLAGSKQVAAGADSLLTAQKQLQTGAQQLSVGQKQVSDGMLVFGQKLAAAQQGSQSLATGLKAVVPGSQQLKDSLVKLSGGVQTLADGAEKLNEGAKKLTDGATAVASGTDELSGKLKDASSQTSGIKGNDQLYQAFAQPINFQVEKVHAVPNYGTGLAPYFLSMSLFVGALMLTIVYPIFEPVSRPSSGFSWFLSKTLTLMAVGLAQAILVDVIMLWGLKLKVESVPLFFTTSILASWCFMAIIQLLVSTMGNPGRFLVLLLMITQLTGSAGTFPVELIPHPLQVVNGWLPMTHSIQAFRAVISSGDFGYMWRNDDMLIGVMGGMVLLSLVYFLFQYKRRYGRPSGSEPVGTAVLDM